MKAYFKVITVAALFTLAFTSYAQVKNDDVRVLPTQGRGFIKVLFVTDNSSDVEVKFYNSQGLYTVDLIDKDTYEKGFIKKYDVRNVHRDESFWIEVSANDVITTYKISPSENRPTYTAHLERTDFVKALMVASKE